MSKRGQSQEKKPLRRVNPRAAGVDIGSATHWVAIDPSLSEQPVREFAAYTGDLQKLADWLLEHKIQTVAMEATGVYWIALFELLRERGLEVCLVDARATKQVAGRKSDISDCQWIQELHSYGLLKQAFIPEAQIATLRSYVRQRDRWVADAARAIQHMQQALELMNVKLTEVVSDITGTTGLAIIDSILAGERNAERLSELRDRRCSRSQEEIARALQFFFTSTPHNKVDYVMLAGGTATLPGLKDRVTELTGFASMVVNPFESMKLGSAVRESKLRREASSYLTACGLAMRRFVQ
jgi:hypothetical protein